MEIKKYNGQCTGLPFKAGNKVMLRKGTPYTSTKGSYQDFKLTGRNHTVHVFSVDEGCDSYTNYHGEVVPARNPSITWVGAGGYWHTAEINKVLEKGGFCKSAIKPDSFAF
jgi:hypothetical protein